MDRKRPKGPDYLIIDNFADFFQIDMSDLIDAKREAEKMSDFSCNSEYEGDGCDKLIWLENLQNQEDQNPGFSKIAKSMAKFRPKLN